MESLQPNDKQKTFIDFCKQNNLGMVNERSGALLFYNDDNANAALELLKESGFNVIKLLPSAHDPDGDEGLLKIKLK